MGPRERRPPSREALRRAVGRAAGAKPPGSSDDVMTRFLRSRVIAVVAMICLAAGLAATPTHGQAVGDVSVVVHPGVPVDNLTIAELRNYLTGEREFWPDRTRVTILIRAPVARARDIAVKDICQMTEAQFRQHWIGKVFRADAASAPKIVYSNDSALETVARTPGAIAFVEGAVTAKNVKVVKVEGRSPGQQGYRLR